MPRKKASPKATDGLSRFTPSTRAWFANALGAPTPIQTKAWDAISGGAHVLILAPTGSGKTLAAFLHAIDRLVRTPERGKGVRVVYVSPLKALAADVEKNLRVPLEGIAPDPPVEVMLRTGDTPAKERRRFGTRPPDVLVTTPESLYLILTSQAREQLRTVETVIVDEIHSLAGTKRGAHLALSLERLERLAKSPQRLGLTATGRPLDLIARFLGGHDPKTGEPRPVTIAEARMERVLELAIEPPGTADTSLLELVRSHRSTIIFAHSRRHAEKLAQQLNDAAEEPLARAHHGSVAPAQRRSIEEQLKRGELKAVVATSSLELGIDVGAVDLVVQVGAPASVASGLQRVGRSGHRIGAPSRGRIFPRHRGELLPSAVCARLMRDGAIEPVPDLENPLDVLAQQIVAMTSLEEWSEDDLARTLRAAAPFSQLAPSALESVLDTLSGHFPSAAFAELRARIVRDREKGTVRGRPFAWRLAISNAGTIPDRGLFAVHPLGGGPRLGELDEEFVAETHLGDPVVLGASTWRVVEIGRDRVYVEPAPGEQGKVPFWRGDAPARPIELGRAIGELLRELEPLSRLEMEKRFARDFDLTPAASEALASWIDEGRTTLGGAVPSDRTLVVETFNDPLGDPRTCVLSPRGERVHAAWALAIEARLRPKYDGARAFDTDDGIVLRLPREATEADVREALFPDPDEVADLILGELARTTLFKGRFRECAARALLLPRNQPGKRSPLWLQRLRAQDLLEAASRFPRFPITLEAYRECLEDVFDLPSLRELLAGVARGEIRTVEVRTQKPSTFSAAISSETTLFFLEQAQAPGAERRVQALSLDRGLLRDLLGHDELRDLVSPRALSKLEEELARTTDERRARSADELHDLLRALGDLTIAEMQARSEGDVAPWLESLRGARRVSPRRLPDGSERWGATEDSALGPRDFVQRFARTHGPFEAKDAAERLGLPVARVEEELAALEGEGRVVQGAFRPGGHGVEWIDRDVLARLRRRSISELRAEVEPREPSVLAAFLPAWHGVPRKRKGVPGLRETLRQLEGVPLLASLVESEILPARVVDYQPWMLDELCASGELTWSGRGLVGPADGKVAFYRREKLRLLAPLPGLDSSERASGDDAARVRAKLETRGASFSSELKSDPDALSSDLSSDGATEGLWALVWAGEVAADSFAPVRAFLDRKRSRSKRVRRMAAAIAAPLAGRFELVARIAGDRAPPPEVALMARAEALLERHGVLTREAVQSEEWPGGFAALYPVLSALEDAGRVRRGYFVKGLGGAQFALPRAVEALRRPPSSGPIVLSALDPASPYGAALPWPEPGQGRRSGAHVALVDGELVMLLAHGRKSLATFSGDERRLELAARELARIPAEVDRVDDVFVLESPLVDVLRRAGFVSTSKGLTTLR